MLKEDKLKRINNVNKEKLFLKEHPDKFISDWIKQIDETLPKLSSRPPKHKGSRTMKQHLIMLRNDLQNNPIKFIEEKEKKLLVEEEELIKNGRNIRCK